ncbi:hypothetical protein VitviT2T_001934 [Vitis vinifera]|uniref:RING-CH-type domain-containing protein n=2 Tax=Vitis vinifera TaxID=29760 RepID=A0ABY9BH49_VITVI|nr:uncharacterized protein LOC100854506 [Vitis vinifera]WJZ82150.1 hypothetical protein VitviT2T_001934 [Vitis vinifera]|eukprot:XP_010660407.1 PREDICTED: E3 ubiquitin-protein ligase MARCH1 [Vitis vinifera]
MQKNGVELEELEQGDAQGSSGEVASGDHMDITLTTILVSNGDSRIQVVVSDGDQLSPKKPHLSRTPSSHDECRVCNADMEEDLIELGCHCRGWLAKAHRTCIDTWFRTRGSNKCEICKQVAVNVPPPESLPSGGFRPVCVALTILIFGLLLDVLVSIVFGVSLL